MRYWPPPGAAPVPYRAGDVVAAARRLRVRLGHRRHRGLLAGLVALGLTVGTLGSMLAYAALTLPSLDGLARATQTLRILDRNGTLVAEIDDEAHSHRSVALAQISPIMQQATISVEDRNFYEEGAFDIARVVKALFVDVIAGRPEQGASTITQQLAKLAFLQPDKSPMRKLREALLAERLQERYTKAQILEMYLNLVYYGHGAYGVENASEVYFGEHASQLDLREASLLAGLPQAPSQDDPFEDAPAAFARQHIVLDSLVQTNRVSRADADAVDPVVGGSSPTSEQRSLQGHNQSVILGELRNGTPISHGLAPHFVEYVRDELRRRFAGSSDALQGNLVVSTTLDLSLQQSAEAAVSSGLGQLGSHGANNAALLMLDASTGAILAMVGSANFDDQSIGGQFNVVTGERRPGSSFKPYVYAEAFAEHRLSADSVLDDTADESARLGGVHDFDGQFLGPIAAADALVLSRNVPAEQAMVIAGVPQVIGLAHSLGIGSDLAENASTAIGTSAVRMIDHAAAYAALANGGRRVTPWAITRVVGSEGEPVAGADPGAPEQVLPSAVTCTVTRILGGYPAQWGLPFNRPTAGKSGTTDGFVDAWYMAYTPQYVVATWAGHTDGTSPAEVGMDGVFGTMVGRSIAVPFVNSLPDTSVVRTARHEGKHHGGGTSAPPIGAPSGCSEGDGQGDGSGAGDTVPGVGPRGGEGGGGD